MSKPFVSLKTMKTPFVRLLIAATVSVAFSAQAADIIKADNATALNDPASWVGGIVPGAGSVAVWDNTVTTANNPPLGADALWQGVGIANPGGLVTIGSGTNILILGTAGINMSAATQDLYLNGASLSVGSSDQTWNVGARYLRLGAGNLAGVLSGSSTITLSGSGIVDLNPTDIGASNFSGKWIINSGATLRTTRHSQSADWDALGSNTSADAVTLNGGTLAVGGFTGSGAQGNWTWANPITLAASTNSKLSEQIPGTAAARTLTLTGPIVGSGNLTLEKTLMTSMNYILNNLGTTAGAKTNVMGTGDITVNGVTLTLRAGSTGNAMTHDNNINLIGGTLVSDDAVQTFAGNITLSGANTIQGRWGGKNVILAGTLSDGGAPGSVTYGTVNATDVIIFVNGTNNYTGTTTLGSGTANSTIVVAGNANAFSTGTINSRGAQLRAGTAGMVIPNPISVAAGGLRVGGTNPFTLSGTIKLDDAPRTIANYSTNGSPITLGAIDLSAGTTATAAFDNAAGGATGAPIVVTGGITGAGKVAISGGTLTLNGVNTYTGATTITGGSVSGTGSITASAVAMSGGSILLAGGATTTGLTMSAGVTFTGTPTVVFASVPAASTAYDVLNYGSGTVTGIENLSFAAHGASLTDDTVNQKLTVTTTGPETRTWNTTTGTWDGIGTNLNWVEGDQKFYNGDSAVFPDIAEDATVTVSGTVNAAAVTAQNNASLYTITGGSITGAAGLTKDNAGNLTINTANSFTGPVTVNGGTLSVGNASALGTTAAGTTIAAGATLNLNGYTLPAGETITLAGTGVAGSALIGAGSIQGDVALTSDATIGDPVAGSVNIGTSAVPRTITGAFTLTKTGTSKVWYRGPADGAGNTLLALVVDGGTFGIEANNNALNAVPITVNAAGILSSWGTGSAPTSQNNPITLNGGTLASDLAGQTYTGDITLTADSILGVSTSAGSFTIAGAISEAAGSFGLNKTQTSTVTLAAENTYSGATTVSAGMLQVGTGTQTTNLIALTSGITLGVAEPDTTGNIRFSLNEDIAFATPVTFAGKSSIFHLSMADPAKKMTVSDATSFSGTDKGIFQINSGVLELAAGADFKVKQFNLSNTTAANAVVSIADGASLTTKYINCGQGASTAGTIVQTGGSVTLLGGDADCHGLRLGHWGSGTQTSTYTITGGVFDATGLSANDGVTVIKNITIGWDGGARMNVGGGTGPATAKVYGINWDGGGAGPASGTLEALENGIVEVGEGGFGSAGAGSAKTVLNGGTLKGTATATWLSPVAMTGNGAIETDPGVTVTQSGAVNGSGSLTKSGSGTLVLSGVNSYTGDTNVDGGFFELADDGGMKFVISANGVNNKITGPAGTATLRGDFTFDLSGAAIADGNSWTLVDTTTKVFEATFTVVGFTEAADVWTLVDGPKTWTFTEATGVLSLATSGGYATWAATNAGGQAANLDFDGDGVLNGVEFFMGATGSTFTANPGVVDGKVTWPKSADFLGTYAVETSPDLATWTAQTVGVVDNGTSVEYTLPTGEAKIFVRLKVTPQ